ncbi:helix-turn-helix domain-containing protein [Tistrella mobilis]
MQLCGLVEGRSGPSFRACSALRGSRPPDRRARGVATPRARFHYARLRPTGGDPGSSPPKERRTPRIRLLEALPRLASGETVTNVALDLGYDSPSAFTAMFRRILGASPREYLRITAEGGRAVR